MNKEEIERYADDYLKAKFGATTGNQSVRDALIHGIEMGMAQAQSNNSNTFTFDIDNAKLKGAFNIYQSIYGGVYIMMGNYTTLLSYKQINELNIPVRDIKNFDMDKFILFYNINNLEQI
jgi:hypothetical protein